MPGLAIAQQPGGMAAPQEVRLEAVPKNPRTAEGFSLPDLSDPAELEYGDVPFERFEGTASIARAKVDWRYRVPDGATRSVMIDHGLGAKEGAYSDLADFLASHGIAVADHKAAHYQGLLAGLHPKHVFDASRLLYQAPWGVIRDIRARKDIDGPTDTFGMVGHSLGGRTAVKNALQHPDDIDHVIAIDSVGLEDHHLPGLALRLPGFFGKDFRRTMQGDELDAGQKVRLVINGVVYFVENPWRSGGEIWSLSRARIGDDMAALEEKDIGTAIVASPDDNLIDADNTEAHSSDKPDVFVRLPELPDKTLDHMGAVRYPEVYGRTIISLLDHLDNIRR